MKKILSTLIISTLILTSCGTPVEVKVEKSAPKNVKTSLAKKDYFTEETRLIGKISTFSETNINPLVSGVVNGIKVEVGQKVKAGQVLAILDLSNSTYGVSYDNAKTSLNNTLASYNLTEESISKDLESAKLQLENARISKINTYTATDKQLEIAKTQLNNIINNKNNLLLTTNESLKNAELSVDNAKIAIENFIKNSTMQIQSLQDQEKSLFDNIKVAIDNANISFDNILTQFDLILGITDKNKNNNDSYESFLGAKYTDSKTQGEKLFLEAKNIYDNNIKTKNFSSNVKIESSLDNIIILADKLSTLADNMVIIMNNSITSTTFTQTQLDGLSATVGAKQSVISSTKSNLITLKNSIKDSTNRITSAQTNIDTTHITLQNALDLAIAQLNNIKAGNISQIDNVSGNEDLLKVQLENTIVSIKQTRDTVDNALKIAETNFNSTQAKLNNQILQVKSQIDNAKGGKDIASIQLNNTSIVSPINGIILSRNIELGTSISPQSPVFIIGDNSKLKVKLDVSSENIGFFKLNNSIKLKDLKGNYYSGIISNKSPSPDSLTKLYKVEILITSNTDKLNIGDFIDIYLEKKSGDKQLVAIPLSSFISFGEGKYGVYLIDDKNIAKLSYITLGKKNNTNVEVISGLKEGDKYVKEGALNLHEGDEIKDIQ